MADNKLKIVLQFLSDKSGLTGAGKAISGLTSKAKKLGTALKTVGKFSFKALAGGAKHAMRTTAVAAGAAAASIKEAAQNNISLARAVNMFGGGMKTFVYFRKQLRDVATDTGIAQQALIAALYKIGSAEIPEDNAIAVLRAASKAFIADGADMEAVIQGLAAVFKPFHMGADQAAVAADKLYTIVKGGQTTFQEVGENLNQAATMAAGSGVSFDQLAAAVTSLTAATIKTPTALNAIRNMIGIVNKELGDGWSETMSFQDALQQLYKTSGESTSAMQKMFGAENISAVLAMVGENAGKAQEHLEKMRNSTGQSLNKAADFVDQFRGWNRIWQGIRTTVDQVGAVFDRVLAPIIKEITTNLKEWRNSTIAFDTLETKLAGIRDKAKDIWTAVTEGGQGKQFFTSIKNLFVGSMKLAAEKLVEILLVAAPMIGAAIGYAAKAATTNLNPFKAAGSWIGAQDAAMADPDYARRKGESRMDMAARRMEMIHRYKKEIQAGGYKNQGLALSDEFAQDTNPELAAAFAGFDQTLQKGRDITEAKAAGKMRQMVEQAIANEETITELLDAVIHAQNRAATDIDQLKSQIKYGPRR